MAKTGRPTGKYRRWNGTYDYGSIIGGSFKEI